MVFENADLLLAVAESAMRERTSGQAALFGGEAEGRSDLRLKPVDPWPRPDRMAKERENFGFYFSAHPVQHFRDIASAQGARSYQSLMQAAPPSGGRSHAVIAAMVESANKGRTKRGAEFIRADFSDTSGQFSAACFEETLVPQFLAWAEASECVLLTVELDSPNPGEPPRLTVRGARPLSSVSGRMAMALKADVHTPEALANLALELQTGDDARGEVTIRLVLDETGGPDGPNGNAEAFMKLGNRFVLDGDLAERLSGVEGIENVALEPVRGRANLKLVA